MGRIRPSSAKGWDMQLIRLTVATVVLVFLSGCGGNTTEAPPTPTPVETLTPIPSATPSDEGYSEADEGVEVTELPVQPGAVVTMPAQGITGRVSIDTPVEVAFESLECAPLLPGLGLDLETYEPADYVAADGNQACLVALKITNQATVPTSFSSLFNSATLLTSEDKEYRLADAFTDQYIANVRGVQSSAYADALQPDAIGYDFAIYEIPASSTPQAVVYRIYSSNTTSMAESTPQSQTEPEISEDPAAVEARRAAWTEEWDNGKAEDRQLVCTFFNANPEGSWDLYQDSSDETVSKTFFMDFYNSVC